MPETIRIKNKPAHSQFDFGSKELICAFSNRQAGNMSLCYGETANSLDNRKAFLINLGIDYNNLVCAKQVHGSNIKYAINDDRGSGALVYENAIADTDAFVTDHKNLVLSVFTADCLSVFLYDPKASAIGLVHAGWRSTKEEITLKTINFMQEKFKTKPQDLYVGFGPCIRSCCYEVDRDFEESFPREILTKEGRYYLDLIETNRRQAQDAGALALKMFDSGICTFCSKENFFSFRREGKNCGRMISLMMLR